LVKGALNPHDLRREYPNKCNHINTTRQAIKIDKKHHSKPLSKIIQENTIDIGAIQLNTY